MIDKTWGGRRHRVTLRLERRRGVSVGVSAAAYLLGSHYEWEGDNQVWYEDRVREACLYLLRWKLELCDLRSRRLP